MIVGGTQSEDAYNQVKGLVQLNYNPKFLFLSNGASSPVEFPSKVGKNNVEGIFSCGDWFPTSKANGNPQFVAAYIKKYGGTALDIDSDVGRGVRRRAADPGRGQEDRQGRQRDDHQARCTRGTWPSVEGNISWNADGAPQGSDMLLQWVNGKLQPVFPPRSRCAQPIQPKPQLGRIAPDGSAALHLLDPGARPGRAGGRRLRADGERADARVRRDEGDQRGPGGDDRRRRVPQLHAVHEAPHRPVRVDRDPRRRSCSWSGWRIQLVFIRPLRSDEREELSLLVTWALALGIEGLLSLIYKTNYHSTLTSYANKSWSRAGYRFSEVRVFAFVISAAILAAART